MYFLYVSKMTLDMIAFTVLEEMHHTNSVTKTFFSF